MRVIDMADDLGETYLASLGDAEPAEFFKTAEWRESYDILDRDYALILVDEENREFRKFASHDAGNTWMSIFYLLNGDHGLSETAVKVAAVNLAKRAASFDLELDDDTINALVARTMFDGEGMDERRLQMKVAFPLKPFNAAARAAENVAMHAGPAPMRMANLGTAGKAHAAENAVTQMMPKATPIPMVTHTTTEHKISAPAHSEAGQHIAQNHTATQPGAGPGPGAGSAGAGPTPGPAAAKDPKAGGSWVTPAALGAIGGAGLAAGAGAAVHGRTAQASAPAGAGMLSGGMAGAAPTMPSPTKMSANMGASPTPPMVRLASYDLIKMVETEWHDMDPYERHDAAVQLCKVASLEGALVPEYVDAYSSEVLNPEFESVMAHRQRQTINDELIANYDRLGKVAGMLTTDEAVEALYLIDEQAGLLGKYGSRLPDPVLAVYGHKKEASYSWIEGGLYVNERQIRTYAENPTLRARMKALFTVELFDKFRANPLETFKKLPEEQKRVLARLATQSDNTNDGGMIT